MLFSSRRPLDDHAAMLQSLLMPAKRTRTSRILTSLRSLRARSTMKGFDIEWKIGGLMVTCTDRGNAFTVAGERGLTIEQATAAII